MVVDDFIVSGEERRLIALIDREPWSNDLKRRVQHYGWRYDYKARRIDDSMRLGDLPDWLAGVTARIGELGRFPSLPDQIIVNEYLPGQGIAPHVDCAPCFGEVIASLSLGSSCVMELTRREAKEILPLSPRSLLVLSSEARYEWRHGIPARKADRIGDCVVARDRRVSLTFRSVVR